MKLTNELANSSEQNLAIVPSSEQELIKSNNPIKREAANVPTFEKFMERIQQAAIDPGEDVIPYDINSAEFQKELLALPTLLQQDKAKAQKIINKLVMSAKTMTHDVASSLSAVPLHPYEKLIYDYLGPNFVAPTIDQYMVPIDFNPVTSVRELEKISIKASELEMTHYAHISSEAMNMEFDGTFETENLNNAFAVPSVDSEGNQVFEIDKERLAEHLKFAEMVKNIPTDYIVKNPIQVAKIILSEFIRIHKVEDHEITKELVSDSQFGLHEIVNSPFEVTKKILNNYQMLNGGSSEFDLAALFKAYDKLNNLELLQEIKPKLTK